MYCLSHHLQGRVHDSDPMGGTIAMLLCRPGFSSTRRCSLCSSFAFLRSVAYASLLLVCRPKHFIFSSFFVWLFFFFTLPFFFPSPPVYRGSWRIYICCACQPSTQWHDIVLQYCCYLVHRTYHLSHIAASVVPGSLVTTEIVCVSLYDEESARTLGVLDVDE